MEVGQPKRGEQARGGSTVVGAATVTGSTPHGPPTQHHAQIRGWWQTPHHNAREVDVCHHQHVELTEQGELVQRARRFAVCLASLPEVLDGPAIATTICRTRRMDNLQSVLRLRTNLTSLIGYGLFPEKPFA